MSMIISKKILVVDDEPLLCEIWLDLFTASGAEVTLADGGHKAQELLKNEKYDILFSDVRMPLGDGIQLVKSLTPEQKNNMLIYFCSGFNDLSDNDLVQLGVRKQFQKPFDFNKVLEYISSDLTEKKS